MIGGVTVARPLLIAAGLLFVFGCGTGAKRAELIGNVSLDGKPLDDATISFVPSAGSDNHPAWAQVKAGHYAIDASQEVGLGVSRVEIRAIRPTGRILPASGPPGTEPDREMREIVPKRYNIDSELTSEIKPGKNEFNFELKSK